MAKFWPKLLFWLKTEHTFQYPPSSSSIFMMSVLKMSINILHHFYIRPNSECRVGQANHIAILIECSRHFLNPQNDYLMTQIDKKRNCLKLVYQTLAICRLAIWKYVVVVVVLCPTLSSQPGPWLYFWAWIPDCDEAWIKSLRHWQSDQKEIQI